MDLGDRTNQDDRVENTEKLKLIKIKKINVMIELIYYI